MNNAFNSLFESFSVDIETHWVLELNPETLFGTMLKQLFVKHASW